MYRQRQEIDNNLVGKLAKDLNVSEFYAKVLYTRGIRNVDDYYKFNELTYDDFEDFNNYHGVKQACERIRQAIKKSERVVVYGDYDCDGVCATAMLYDYLKDKLECTYYIPNRNDEGYGLHNESLELIAEKAQPDLLITVDCGIASKDEIEYAYYDLGFDIIVTDHHKIPDELPGEYCICVNPHIDEKTEKNRFCDYSGAGVVFRLIEALESKETASKYLELAMIATIADMMPLREDNRCIVKMGLEAFNKKRLYVFEEFKRVISKEHNDIKASDIAFRLAPRLNAIGRLADAQRAVEIFTTSDRPYIKQTIAFLDSLNKQRQEETESLIKECIEYIIKNNIANDNVIVIYNKYWLGGVLGIVAARLTKIYNRPVLILTHDNIDEVSVYSGSGRSVEGIDLFELLMSVKDSIYSFGGHKGACGLKVFESEIENFREKINIAAENIYTDDNKLAKLYYDFDIEEQVSESDIRALEDLEPTGMSNYMPIFKSSAEQGNFIRIAQSNHIKEKIGDFERLGFYSLGKTYALNQNFKRYYLEKYQINSFNGKENLQSITENIHIPYIENRHLLNDDDLFVRYIANFSGLLKSDYKNLRMFDNIEDMLSNIGNEKYNGVVYIAYLRESMEEFLSLVEKIKLNLYQISILAPESDMAINRAILSISTPCDLSKYSKIVFIDNPISSKIFADLNISKNAQIFTLKGLNGIINDRIRGNILSREQMLEVYKKLNSLLSQKGIFSISSIFKEYKETIDNNANSVSIYTTIFTFLELKLLVYTSEGFKIMKGVKANLDDSVFLKNIREFIK